jgi:hypothetical protein
LFEALRDKEARSAEQAAREATHREAAIRNALAAPAGDWIGDGHSGERFITIGSEPHSVFAALGYEHYQPVIRGCPRECYLDADALADPRIVARREEVERTALPGAVAAWEARIEEWRAWTRARMAARRAEEAYQ